VANLALGVAVAVLLSRDWPELVRPWAGLLAYWKTPRVEEPAAPRLEPQAPSPPQATPVPAAGEDMATSVPDVLQLSQDWRERLNIHHLQPKSIMEAALHLIRVEEEAHRARWMLADQSLRKVARQTGMSADPVLAPMREEAAAWINWARQFLEALQERKAEFSAQEVWRGELEELLLDQIARMQGLRDLNDSWAADSDVESTLRRFLRECSTVFEKSFALRDFALDRLACLMAAEDRLAEMPEVWRRDPVTGAANRLGLEVEITNWTKTDPSRKRLVSGAFIEIDRLGKLNDRLGIQQTDEVVKAFSRLVEGVVRTDRGDRIMRAAGPTLFVLLSDTGIGGAKAAAERIRQTVEAATFESRSEEFTLAANCAVCEFTFDDTVPDLLARLRAGITEAKRGGRNRTAVDEGKGPELFDAQPMQVKAQTITVGA
jgi:diguanylate cyclase (GGDEF)-like protein